MSRLFIFLNLFILLSYIVESSCNKKVTYYDYYGNLAKDDTTIDRYLAAHNITAQKTSSGLRIVVLNKGYGLYPSPGKSVRINYEGRLLDSTLIENNYDNQVALQFSIGDGVVIPGLNEGVQYIAERGKASIYIPSPLGYQDVAQGDLVPANSILVYTIDLLSVQK